MNPGGVRADLTFAQISGGEQPGQVTYGEAFAVQPFGNLLVTMDLTGAQIERLLEQQAIDDRAGGREVLILGVSEGFSFSYNPAGAFGDRIDPATIALNGTVLNPTATYRIVTNNFLADGGDCLHGVHRRHQPGRAAATTLLRSRRISAGRTRRLLRPPTELPASEARPS